MNVIHKQEIVLILVLGWNAKKDLPVWVGNALLMIVKTLDVLKDDDVNLDIVFLTHVPRLIVDPKGECQSQRAVYSYRIVCPPFSLWQLINHYISQKSNTSIGCIGNFTN